MTARAVLVEVGEHAGRAPIVVSVEPGQTLRLGREAPIVLAAQPPDPRVSRTAVEVLREGDGWTVLVHNRNGVVVHPWGLPAWPARGTERLTDRRVALRVNGSLGRLHWILLESDETPGPPMSTESVVLTELGRNVRPLTPAQIEVLAAMFADLIAWPPVMPAEPRQIKQVARQLAISDSAVQARLNEIRAKAETLGLARVVPLTDPEYLHVLVRAGYLTPPSH